MFMHVHMCLDTLCMCVSTYGDRLILGTFLIVFLLLYWGSLLRGFPPSASCVMDYKQAATSSQHLHGCQDPHSGCPSRAHEGNHKSTRSSRGNSSTHSRGHSSRVSSRIETCKWQASLEAIINLLHGLFYAQGQILAGYNFSCRKQNRICNKISP